MPIPKGRARAAGAYVPVSKVRAMEAMKRECPKCRARVGEGCRDPRCTVYIKPVKKLHAERYVIPGREDEEVPMDLGDLLTEAERSAPEDWNQFSLKVRIPGLGDVHVVRAEGDADVTGSLIMHLEELPSGEALTPEPAPEEER
jgi:hypothetical protein